MIDPLVRVLGLGFHQLADLKLSQCKGLPVDAGKALQAAKPGALVRCNAPMLFCGRLVVAWKIL